jgi:hypothetical protein
MTTHGHDYVSQERRPRSANSTTSPLLRSPLTPGRRYAADDFGMEENRPASREKPHALLLPDGEDERAAEEITHGMESHASFERTESATTLMRKQHIR